MENTGSCVKCRAKREIKDPKPIITKNGRKAIKGHCSVCETGMMRFIKSK